jgi:hypothetical protein
VQEVCLPENVNMKRDMDLVRELLLAIECDLKFDGTKWFTPASPEELGITNHSMDEVSYNLTMLIEEGFIKGKIAIGMGVRDEMVAVINKLTWKGHEFLDDTRDPDIWNKAKERAKGLSGIGIAFMWEIAKAEIRTKLHLP